MGVFIDSSVILKTKEGK